MCGGRDLHGPAWTCMDLHGRDLRGPAWTCMAATWSNLPAGQLRTVNAGVEPSVHSWCPCSYSRQADSRGETLYSQRVPVVLTVLFESGWARYDNCIYQTVWLCVAMRTVSAAWLLRVNNRIICPC